MVILTAIGAHDRPGIIAALSSAALDVGANLDDATMTRLHGAFANMLAVKAPDDEAIERLREKLEHVSREFDLQVSIDPIPDEYVRLEPDHQVTVHGADRPGIVQRVTSALARHGANILDLKTRVAGPSGHSLYIMLLETSGGDWNALIADLAQVAEELDVRIKSELIETDSM